jgi:hypothetical protein
MSANRYHAVPLACLLLGFSGTVLHAAPPAPGAPIDFNRDIRPILSNHCSACHGPDPRARKANLRLDDRESAFGKTKSGAPRIVPHRLDQSELWARVSSDEPSVRMPPARAGKPLSPQQIDLLKRWIEQGAPWQQHWAYRRPQRATLPAVRAGAWPRNAVDHFLLARMEKAGLTPSPEADRATLIRRLSLDLVGLPPSPQEVDDFLADSSPEAYERVVDRLLASPHFGERWAQYWLDLARYADTNGYHIDNHRDMWKWRDWVVEAFNANTPFDRFTVEQLAGDLLPGATLSQKIASGFNRNGMVNFEGGADPDEYLTKYIVDRVVTTSTVWLGTTLACTECHDHKYDPFTQKEFYQLYAFFHNVPERGLDGQKENPVPSLRIPGPAYERKKADLARQRAALAERIRRELAAIVLDDKDLLDWGREARTRKDAKLPPAVRAALAVEPDKRPPQQAKLLRDHFVRHVYAKSRERFAPLNREEEQLTQALAALEQEVPSVMVMEEMPKPRDTFVLVRGNFQHRGEKVEPGVPAVLPPLPSGVKRDRLALARWLVLPEHPLTARVTVNRYWEQLFGTGLVKTGEDFGSQGDWPSHPELLDWLAVEFVEQGWDVKRLLKLLVTSSAYRQSGQVRPVYLARDPENRLLARAPRYRLSAEALRDNALSVSGLLVRQLGGPSVRPYQPAGLWEQLAFGGGFSSQSYVQSKGNDLYRRGLYTYWKRSLPHPSLVVFDAPNREVCTDRRPRTNTPLQALVLLNDPIQVECARVLGQRILREGGATPEDRLDFAFRLCTARSPRPEEKRILLGLYERQLIRFRENRAAALRLVSVGESARPADLDVSELAAWTAVGNVLLNLDETVTRG